MRKILSCALVGSLLIVSCKEDTSTNTEVKRAEIKFNKEGTLTIKKAQSDSIIKTIDIEIADDEYERATGLMYRKSMADNRGMLFIFPGESIRSFYMKNTEIPLDIIYLDGNKRIVNIIKDAQPMDETTLPSGIPAKYVLEINGGLSDSWNLETGDYIEFTAE